MAVRSIVAGSVIVHDDTFPRGREGGHKSEKVTVIRNQQLVRLPAMSSRYLAAQ